MLAPRQEATVRVSLRWSELRGGQPQHRQDCESAKHSRRPHFPQNLRELRHLRSLGEVDPRHARRGPDPLLAFAVKDEGEHRRQRVTYFEKLVRKRFVRAVDESPIARALTIEAHRDEVTLLLDERHEPGRPFVALEQEMYGLDLTGGEQAARILSLSPKLDAVAFAQQLAKVVGEGVTNALLRRGDLVGGSSRTTVVLRTS